MSKIRYDMSKIRYDMSKIRYELWLVWLGIAAFSIEPDNLLTNYHLIF